MGRSRSEARRASMHGSFAQGPKKLPPRQVKSAAPAPTSSYSLDVARLWSPEEDGAERPDDSIDHGTDPTSSYSLDVAPPEEDGAERPDDSIGHGTELTEISCRRAIKNDRTDVDSCCNLGRCDPYVLTSCSHQSIRAALMKRNPAQRFHEHNTTLLLHAPHQPSLPASGRAIATP